jgi:Ala-tRNA(Pro) deacylase
MTDMSTQPTAERSLTGVRARLDAAAIRYELVEHAPASTAAEEARAAGNALHETVKSLVLIDRGNVHLAVIPASRRLDIDRARRALRAGRHLRLATEEEAHDLFPEFEVGAVPPFAAKAVPKVIDPRLLYRHRVLCSAGDHRHSVQLDARDLFRLTEPRVADICVPVVGEHRFAEVTRV